MHIELTDEQRALQTQLRGYFRDLVTEDEADVMLTDRHGEIYHDVVTRMGRDGCTSSW